MPKILIEIDTDTQVVVPRVPTVSSETKSKFMGEFSWSESLEDGVDEVVEHVVPWWVCKEIFHRMAQHWIADAPQPAQPAPIPTSDRLPTEADADPFGNVLALDSTGSWDVWSVKFVQEDCSMQDCFFVAWLPTGLKMPPAPGGSDD